MRPDEYKHMLLNVRIMQREGNLTTLVKQYHTDIADGQQRRVFAEQMTNAYAGGQMVYTSPIVVEE